MAGKDKPMWQRGPSQRHSELDGFTPQQRERIAKWLERKAARLPKLIALSEAYSREHPGDAHEVKQRTYWINYVAIVKHLAYLLRAEKVRSGDGLESLEGENEND